MQGRRTHDNPFDLNKASDFSDKEIAELWVDLADSPGGLLGILKPTLRMPMLLLGGKGSGKTHLMRYISAPVQAMRRGGDLRRAIEEDGFMGVYVRADGLNIDKFAGKGHTDEFWTPIYGTYFELWLATSLIGILRDYVDEGLEGFDEQAFASQVGELFDLDMSGEFDSIETMLAYLTRARKGIDYAVNNASLSGTLDDVRITFSTGRLVFGIPALMTQLVPGLGGILIVYLIDELENFSAGQQRYLNSLIRYRWGNATIKLGARLYGIKTYDTLGSGEPIKRDAEYERVELDNLLRERRKDYEHLVTKLVAKRLESLSPGAEGDAVIARQFAQLDSRDYWRAATEDLVSGSDPSRLRPYLQRLKSDLLRIRGITPEVADDILAEMEIPENFYLEKAAVFYFRKRRPRTSDEAVELAQRAAAQARALLNGRREDARELSQLIAHFDSDILAQLYRDFRKRVPYSGFNTLVDLSQGIPRNLLTNLKYIYRRSQFAGEKPFAGGIISIRSQTEGVRDGAAWFWEDAQPDSDGMLVREAVESLAILFRTVRFSNVPSECDLCTFSVASDSLTPNSRKVLMISENWSYLIRLKEPRRNKNNRNLDLKYQLGPMLAPKWEISEHRRGSMELGTEFANAIFDPDLRDRLPALFKQRVEAMIAPLGSADTRLAGELFDQ
ncbi:MAG: hypothetical protein J0I47_02105 [Sphingomonas sp.]|uniref:ORC-CDC6 family AAA ATPase n=1 Tax=Sphingomonas sp. TaxID=28214 RepID=UPI001AC114DC|nr:hypothetical protein [Sphingomonas sp.]MBN8807022.1 hypothetical protein [Sphingomonas sp.]